MNQRRGQRLAQWVARHEPWLFGLLVPWFGVPTRWTALGLLPLALIWLCRRVATGRWSVRTWLDLPLVALLIHGLIGLYPSVELEASRAGFWRIFLGVTTYYTIVNRLRTREQLRRWTILLVSGGLGLALLTLLGTRWEIVRLANWSFIYDRLPGLLRDVEDGLGFHPRIMGMALAMLAPIPLALALSSSDRLVRRLAAVTLPVMLLVIGLTQSVQAVLGLGVALLALLIWYWRWTLLLIPAGALLAAWATTLPAARALGSRLLAPDDPLGIAVLLRLDMWRVARDMLHDMPYTGIGLNTFPTIQSHIYPGFLIGPEPHAHQLYLQVALDLGVFGLITFLLICLIFGMIVRNICVQRPDRDVRALAIGLAGSLISYLASGLIDTFWTTKPALLLWVVLGSAAALQQIVAPPRPPGLRWLAGWGLAIGLIALFLPSGALGRNLALIEGIDPLVRARATGQIDQARLANALPLVRQAAAQEPANPNLLALLASLEAWQGNYPAALLSLKQRVQRDGPDALERYAPPGPLRQPGPANGSPGAADSRLAVYNQWMNRFAGRAETYVQVASVWQDQPGDLQQAQAIIQQGVQRGAEPQGLLLFYLQQLQANK